MFCPLFQYGKITIWKCHISKKNTSLDPHERVLLGPEGKRDELVGDSREARKRQCAVDELLDDHRRKERRAAKP